jgi:hypothetical protein
VAPLFTFIAIAQTLFVRHEVQQPIIDEQKAWAEEINQQLAYTNEWKLDGYRNAVLNIPGWFVITADGFVVVSGRSKPAREGRMKTSHFEERIALRAVQTAQRRDESTQRELATFDNDLGGAWLVPPADCA